MTLPPSQHPALCPLGLLCLVGASFVTPTSAAGQSYRHFESGPVRPVALAPSGQRLFVTNISDGRIEVFDVVSDEALAAGEPPLRYRGAVPVGLEPVAVVPRTDDEVWVVNHLSDSVSIVDVGADVPHVVRTLLVGDEPRALVFGGTDRGRAFVTTARRGQNSPVDAALTTPGVGRANVWVFDVDDLGTAAGGSPEAVLTLFGDTPRALAVSPGGRRVYAAVFHSGNQTIALGDALVTPVVDALRGAVPSIVLGPAANVDGVLAPPVGRILTYDAATDDFVDENGIPWTPFVPFRLPDLDVFEIDAAAPIPRVRRAFPHVGTVLFDMAVDPRTGRVLVTNTDAQNHVRFEGPGTTGGTTVRGHLHEARITVIDPDEGTVTPVHLNPHIDYDATPEESDARRYADRSLATPLDLAFTGDGATVFVAAMGSGVVAALDPDALVPGMFSARVEDQVPIDGGGPAGLALDEARQRLYVYSRFTNAISVVDVRTHPGVEIAVVPLSHDPEPAAIRAGRRMLYDARRTSANGEASCASCHVFARTDDLAWDLGNPDASVLQNDNVQLAVPIDELAETLPGGFWLEHHPMKGPMLTQNLRGMANHGPMHWRGDRSGGTFRDDPASLDEHAAFRTFAGAFRDLLGRTGPPTADEMDAFATFALAIPYPPSPIRRLDDRLRPEEARGRRLFEDVLTSAPDAAGEPQLTCEGCHVRSVALGFFGTSGRTTFDGLPQMFKIPHLRALYERVGMFGAFALPGDRVDVGDQIRGYGFQHDGFGSTLFEFLRDTTRGGVFAFPGEDDAARTQARRDLEAFLFAFDTDVAPVVGQQVTVQGTGGGGDDPGDQRLLAHRAGSVQDRLDLFQQAAAVVSPRRRCGLVVRAVVDGRYQGFWRLASGRYRDDTGAEHDHDELTAVMMTAGAPWTVGCAYPGGARRIGIDRDDDGIPDGRQCGDVDGDGAVGAHDAERLRRALLVGNTVPFPDKCNVTDALGETPGTCSLVDLVAIDRAARGLPSAAAQRCAAAAR